MRVQDNSKVRVINYRWAQEIKVLCWGMMLTDYIAAHSISVRDHYLCLDGEDYKIISFFSGPEDVCGPKGSYTINRRKECGVETEEIETGSKFDGDVYRQAAFV